ncbi:flagellar biosynthesis protein FlhB [Nevskia sp.]|uniref:flagellar biosynthesis protein FlhB n=1 Tax=Nevskia sp. TaxID=1929292 RepID=UPI0025D4527A|nr:flagellar biosynthesis protein FlhB [Nevskia sp.]
MSDSAEEKTLPATEKRKREAREKGQVPRSRELTTAVVMGAGAALMASLGGSIGSQAQALLRNGLSFDAAALTDPSRMPALLGSTLAAALVIVAPILFATLLAALLAPMLIGGWNFSLQAIQPDLNRLNPITGFGRMFSSNSLVELAKSLAKFCLVGLVAGLSWWGSRGELLGLGTEASHQAIGHGLSMVVHTFVWMVAALGLIAAIDVPWQLWSYYKQLKMSRQEIREEYKQSEGRPEVKGRIRRMQQELSQRRMMDKVPQADVIVTNPTHYAVALQYSAGKMRAPKVIAKGVDTVAFAIRELGRQHGITTIEAPPLARALYRGCDLEEEIPAPLYAAVAQVLTYVYQLKAWRGGNRPLLPKVGDVPGGEPDPEPDGGVAPAGAAATDEAPDR